MALVKTTINDQIGGLFYIDEAASSTKVTLGTSGTFSIHQIKIDSPIGMSNIYYAVVREAGTAGTTAPANAITVKFLITSA